MLEHAKKKAGLIAVLTVLLGLPALAMANAPDAGMLGEAVSDLQKMTDNPEKLDSTSWHVGLPREIVADIRGSFAHPERLPYFQITPQRRPTLARRPTRAALEHIT